MLEDRIIRIGNQTAYSAATVMRPFEFAVENRFDAFEWFPDKKTTGEGWMVKDLPTSTRTDIRRISESRNIRLSVHAPWPSDPLAADDRASFPETVEFAKEIGASLLNVHLRADLGPDAFVEALLPLLELLKGAGIRLSVENTVYTSPYDFNAFFRRLRSLGHARSVGMCLDIGHANLSSGTRNDYIKFLDLLDEEVPVIHIHMHENYGDRDSHLTIFTGPAGRDASGIEGLIRRLRRRNFSGSIILEQWPEPQGLLIYARDRLLNIIRETPISGEEAESTSDMSNMPDIDEDVVKRFAAANRDFTSWRERLQWIEGVLKGDPGGPGLDLLIYVAIYLRFLGTGQIKSLEEGGHHRPSHHARLSELIYRRLSEIENAENVFVIRKIYPWLPSFDTEFMRAEPLTRIRDIAHRNDIPKELKHEIKTTLQNKLHRSAGPEDLATSEALLKKITASEAAFPVSFVEEFRRFHKELTDFFNAGSLKEMLTALKEKGDFATTAALDDFLGLLEKCGGKENNDQSVKELELLTGLRRSLRITGKISYAKKHRLRTIDIRLEDHLFVLLSGIVNSLSAREEMSWETSLRVLGLTIENLGLGGIAPEECRAIGSELIAWQADFDAKDRNCLLRLKATAERCRRVAEEYSDKILSLFPAHAESLGAALGVPGHAVDTFSEAVIRSHPVFQLSRLVGPILREIRTAASLRPWDVIVPGEASGRLAEVRSLGLITDTGDGPLIVFTEKAEGDEEIPSYVTGIIIASETPLLSHLAVRARQRGTVFVSCEESEKIDELKKFSGRPIRICVTGVTFEIDNLMAGHEWAFVGGAEKVDVSETSRDFPSQKILPLEMVNSSMGGAKADGARLLAEMAKRRDADFGVPQGVVIPFGVMEESLRSMPSVEAEYYSVLGEIGHLSPEKFEEKCKRLRELVLPPDDILVSDVIAHFGKDRRVMVRSSSNYEDLKGFSGAGLYDSVPNVAQSEISSAVRRVWASLWNRRAAGARRDASVPPEKARMAVLIQTMLPADISFIMHTVNPINDSEDEILIESAVGLGETLASGREPGAPFRAVYDKHTADIEMLSFSSYSSALLQNGKGEIVRRIVDYSKVPFSSDKKIRSALSSRVGKIGASVETSFGLPLDIEGLLTGERVYLLQARPQQRSQKRCLR